MSGQFPLQGATDTLGTRIAVLWLMFIDDFAFSFSLLAFAAVLLVLGLALLSDGLVRLIKEGYKEWQKDEPVSPALPPLVPPAEEATTLTSKAA
jgi:hypothetical protein